MPERPSNTKSEILHLVEVFYKGKHIGYGYFIYSDRNAMIKSSLTDFNGIELKNDIYSLKIIEARLGVVCREKQ